MIEIYETNVHEGRSQFTHVAVIDWEGFKSIGNGGQLEIGVIPAGGAVELVYVDKETAIVGTSTLVIDIGTTAADPDEFINALTVHTVTVPVFNTGDVMVQTAGTSTFKGGNLPVKPVTADTPILLEVTDANIADITAGRVLIGMRILDPRRFIA